MIIGKATDGKRNRSKLTLEASPTPSNAENGAEVTAQGNKTVIPVEATNLISRLQETIVDLQKQIASQNERCDRVVTILKNAHVLTDIAETAKDLRGNRRSQLH